MTDVEQRKVLAEKFAAQKKEREDAEAEHQAKMKASTDEITNLTLWFAKNKYSAQHNTVL
jgi:hypothetical protein